MTESVSSKIAKYAHDFRSRLLQEQGKSAAKMTKYDVALFMKNQGDLSEAEFNSWIREKEGQDALQLTNQQKDAIKRGSIMNFVVGLQSYLDSDEVSDFTLGNVLGFEKTTNEKTGATSIKSKQVSKKQFSVAEEMKKQSFYNYIKSLPTPEATYTELIRSIEFDKLDNQGKLEMMLKISGEKFNEAKEKGDKQAMKDYLLEGIGMALQLSCQKIDSAIGITQFKEWAKERSGLNFLVDLVDKYVDDGDEATLTWLEKNWEGVKGFGDALDSFIGTQAIAFMGTLELAGAAAAMGGMGQVFNIATKAYFLYDGGKMMYNGATGYYNATTKQEARQAGTEFGMGTVIFTGTLKSVIGEIRAYRASHTATPESQGGLPELSDGHKAIIEENLPEITNNSQVSTNLAFLQQNGVEIVSYKQNVGFDLIVNGKSVQVSTQGKAGFEQGLSGLVKEIKSEIPQPTETSTMSKIYETVKEKIQDISIPFRLKSKMHDEFHITGNQIYYRKFSEYEAEGLSKEDMLHKFFNVEKLSQEEIQQCYTWLDNIAETRAKIDKSFDTVIPSLTPETYYRGIIDSPNSQVIQIIQNAKVGDIITPNEGYAWYTPKESYAKDYSSNLEGQSSPESCIVMEIHTPAGAKLSRDISINLSDGNILGIQGMNPYGSMNVVTQRGIQYEVLGKEVKDGRTYIKLKYLGQKATSETGLSTMPKTPEGMKQAIIDAKDWDSLRALNKGMKTMPQEVKELYVQRENQLRTELSLEARGVVNWNIQTHLAITEHALEGYEDLSPTLKRYIARASELPDLDPNELTDVNAAHFYDVLHEDPSYGTIDDAVNNALSRCLAHTEKAKEYAKSGDRDAFLKEVGYAVHYLQDASTPLHTEHGSYFKMLLRLPKHIAFERGKNLGATSRLSELRENYTPEELPFSSLEMLFNNTALFSVQPENRVKYTNINSWADIQQRCYDRGVNASKAYLDYILQYLPKTETDTPVTQTFQIKPEVKSDNSNNKPNTKMPIKELLKEPEIHDLLGLEVEVKYESGRKARMTIKEKLEKLAKQNPDLTKNINYVRKIANESKDSQRIQTKELVEIRNKFCSSKINDALYEIECTLESIKDNTVLDFVTKELNEIKNLSTKKEAAERLQNVQLAIDAYNVAEGNYTYIGDKSKIDYPEYRQYLDYLDNDNNVYNTKLHKYPTFKEKYINDKMHSFLPDKIEFLSEYRKKAAELQKNMRFTKLMEFCFKNPDSELSTHLYTEYYLKQAGIPKKIQGMCLNISKKYNTKLFLPKDCQGTEKAIKYVEAELEAYSEAMKGSGDRLRHVIDFSELKEAFEHKRGGKDGADGYIKKEVADNLVNIPGLDIEVIHNALRHELMHTFDNKFGVPLDDIEITVVPRIIEDYYGNAIDIKCKSSKYDEEFIKAGITDPELIDYAYTNSKEFIAVASEGNMSSYSEEFKQLLISKGMPEWAFKLKTINPDILAKIKDLNEPAE